MAFVGEVTKTRNALVAELPVGSVLVVSDQGTLEVIEVPNEEPTPANFEVGDLVDHPKYGSGQVSRMSVRLDNPNGFDPDTQVLVAFDDGVVRAVAPDRLQEAGW